MTNPSCIVIGHGPLPLSCLAVLRSKGFEVRGVLSPDEKLRSAGEALGAVALDHRGKDWSQLLDRVGPFDYLFSIVNFAVLPAEVLQAANLMAINYHDGPLPRYAGMNAPFWALWHGETTHAVSWHEMRAEVDAGDVLEQPPVAIGPDDTSYQLDLKCFLAAGRSFRLLVAKLLSGQLERQPQDQSNRTYFGYYERPPAMGLLDWGLPTATLSRQLRALDFGSHENRLGVPRIVANGRFAVVHGSVRLGRGTPGTVLERDRDGFTVATADGALRLRAINGLTPEPGATLGCSPQLRDRLTQIDKVQSRLEGLWRERLGAAIRQSFPVQTEAPAAASLQAKDPVAAAGRLLAKLAAALGCTDLVVGFRDEPYLASVADLDGLFESTVPVRFSGEPAFAKEVARIRPSPVYLGDLRSRSPGLEGNPSYPVTMSVTADRLVIASTALGRAQLDDLVRSADI